MLHTRPDVTPQEVPHFLKVVDAVCCVPFTIEYFSRLLSAWSIQSMAEYTIAPHTYRFPRHARFWRT